MTSQLPKLPDLELPIRTARLELRLIRKNDASAMFGVLADPRLYNFTSDTPPSCIEALAEVYARRETRHSPDGSELWLNWLLYERQLKRPIGRWLLCHAIRRVLPLAHHSLEIHLHDLFIKHAPVVLDVVEIQDS